MSDNFIPADILIVDDIPDNIHLLSSMLVESGYQVRKVISGDRALNGSSPRQKIETVSPCDFPPFFSRLTCLQSMKP